METARVDEIDRLILRRLTADARASFAEIGEEVGLSATAVKRRVDRLRREGVIVRFTTVVDHRALGGATEAFVELFCASHTIGADVMATAARHEEVVAAYTVSGDADALLHVRTPDITSFEDVLRRIRSEPHIERTRSAVVLSNLLDSAAARD